MFSPNLNSYHFNFKLITYVIKAYEYNSYFYVMSPRPSYAYRQGLGAGAAWGKKSGTGAVAAKKLADSSALRED